MRILLSKIKRLPSMGIINNFFISGRIVNVKITETSRLLAITYLSDITVHFPSVDLSPPSESSQFRLCYTLRSYQVYLIVEVFFL